jgi:hypothetical protein
MMIEQAPYRLDGSSADRQFTRVTSVALALGLVGLNWLATQRAAAAMRYAPFLPGRLIAHIYQPLAWWWWQHRWPQSAVRVGNQIVFLAPIWRVCDHEVIYPMLILGAMAGLCGLFLMKPRHTDLHGSASWADAAEMKRAGLL